MAYQRLKLFGLIFYEERTSFKISPNNLGAQ